MPVLQVVLLAAWTLVVVRMLAWRATLTNRTFATYIAVGVFGGAIAVGLTQRLLNPYGETQPLLVWLFTAGRQFVLLLPVLVWFFWRPVYRNATIADAFLLAFCAGFGFDLSGALLTASAATAPLRGYAWLPPWQFHNGAIAGAPWDAGSGYWTGLVALAAASGFRFRESLEALRARVVRTASVGVPAILATAAFLWVVAEQTSVLAASDAAVYRFVRHVVFSGRYTAWITLLLLIVVSLAEIRVDELAGGGRASLDDTLRRAGTEWRRHVRGMAAFRRPAPGRSLSLVLWALLAVLFLVLPLVPARVSAWWWTLPLMTAQMPVIGLTVFNAAVAVLLLHWYLAAPPVPASTEPADAFVRAGAEDTILHGGLGVIVLLMLHSAAAVYPFYSVASVVTGAALPAFTTTQAPTFLLLLAATVSSLAAERTARWRSAPVPERRVAALRRWRTAAAAFIIAWASLLVYLPILAQIHGRFGAAFFTVGRLIGLPGNFLAAMLAVVITAAFGWGALLLLRSFGPFDDGEASRRGMPRVVGWFAGVP